MIRNMKRNGTMNVVCTCIQNIQSPLLSINNILQWLKNFFWAIYILFIQRALLHIKAILALIIVA